MGLLNNILEKDLHNCYESIKTDEMLKATEKQFYELLKDRDKNYQLAMEGIFNAFTAQALRIAYLQGLLVFYELFIELLACAILKVEYNLTAHIIP